MKILHGAVCGFVLTAAAFGQAPAPTTPSSNARPATPSMQQMSGMAAEPKAPEHPLTMEQMKQLYDEMGYGKTMDQTLQTMLTMQKSRAPFIPQDVWDDFEATSKKIDYPTLLLPAYQKYLSTEDAAKAIDFGKTEAGKRFLETIPATSREILMTEQKQQQQVGQEVQARHKDEIEAAVKKYRDEHQPKPAPSLGPVPASPSAPSSSPSSPQSSPAPATPPTAPK